MQGLLIQAMLSKQQIPKNNLSSTKQTQRRQTGRKGKMKVIFRLMRQRKRGLSRKRRDRDEGSRCWC